MEEISFGPVVNPDGSPTEFTKEMFNVTSDDILIIRYKNRMEQLRSAIANDFATEKWNTEQYRGATLQATLECVKEMLDLHSKIQKLETKKHDEIVAAHCKYDCGCAGGQSFSECTFEPSCSRCWLNGKS